MLHSPGFLKIVDDAKARIRQTTVGEVSERIRSGERFVLVDVREDHEWESGHIAGAVHIGRGVLERDIEAQYPDKGTELVLYCGGGYRSALAADSLRTMGYEKVSSMDGGWRGWTEAGLPTAT